MLGIVAVFSAVIIIVVFALYYWTLSKGYEIMPEVSKIDPLPEEEDVKVAEKDSERF